MLTGENPQLQTKEQIKTKLSPAHRSVLPAGLASVGEDALSLRDWKYQGRGYPRGPYLLRGEGEGDGRTVCVWRGDWEGSEM